MQERKREREGGEREGGEGEGRREEGRKPCTYGIQEKVLGYMYLR